ncbi:MAG: transcriptional regulator NrdR [Pseudomonadota bacterium]
MRCPFCLSPDTKVTDSRLVGDGDQIRRRRECLTCAERFSTYEVVEIAFPRVVKRDGSRQVFNEEKLRQGLLRALEKRPVSVEAFEQAMRNLTQRLRAQGDREISSQVLGEWVMEALKELDLVAYIRFASVYLRFENLNAFRKEIEDLIRIGHETHEH